MRCIAWAAVAWAATAWLVSPAWAGALDRVRSEKILHCGAEPRPTFASALRDGSVGGLAINLCRAVADTVLGPGARIAFTFYDLSLAYDAVRAGRDELFFLSDDAVAEEGLTPYIMRGLPVFSERLALMVPRASPAMRPQDLAGETICFMIATNAERALDAAFHLWRLDFQHMAFEEDVEMLDAYNVQRCGAIAAETSELGVLRRNSGINHLASRILPDALASYPVFAATSVGDPDWSALVFGVISRRVSIDWGQAGVATRQARE